MPLLRDRRANRGEAEAPKILVSREFGQGRIIAAGHDSMIQLCDPSQNSCPTTGGTDTQLFFLKLVTDWLASGNRQRHDIGLIGDADSLQSNVVRTISIAIATGHCEINPDFYERTDSPIGERLIEMLKTIPGYRVKTVSRPWIANQQLAGVDVLIVGNAWGNINDEEIEAVTAFVRDGGGLLATGLGWSWQQYLHLEFGRTACPPHLGLLVGQDPSDLTTYPMNRLLAPFGASFSGKHVSR